MNFDVSNATIHAFIHAYLWILYFWRFLQIDSSAVVEMEIIESDESDYEVEPSFSGERSDAAEIGRCYLYLVSEVPEMAMFNPVHFGCI